MAEVPRYPRYADIDPAETQEWLESLRAVLERDGPDRARFLLDHLLGEAWRSGVKYPRGVTTPYVNTIPPEEEETRPGDGELERRIKSLVRWNAAAMVVRANKQYAGLGGHIGTFASAANLYEVGFNHFFRAPNESRPGDLIFYQGHSSPGFYARAFLEGRLSEEDLDNFRREVDTPGLSSYPHPHLMPGFWSLPTVSMGLGPIMSIYQARFMKYLEARGIVETGDRHVWAFLGDGEMDEPESIGAISIAAREKLDNLIFVINCNLQRLDGPVRGNGKIIQELEGLFRGAGWNVIKVVWGGNWDPLLERDHHGLLKARMMEAVDGEYQAYAANGGAYVREHFFGKHPELLEMVEDMEDEELWKLKRGGHDPQKVYAAYAAAVKHREQPTVILAKTVKGYGMGEAGEGQNIIHQQKKMEEGQLVAFRDRFDIPLSHEQARNAEFYRPSDDSDEIRYLKRRREALGGPLPIRIINEEKLEVPGLDAFDKLLDRLLASPRYGERWGRHWLDVVRFAETEGFEYDRHRPGAWRYRDYVVDSFNRDKSFDRFVLEQLAGDELDARNHELLVAAGVALQAYIERCCGGRVPSRGGTRGSACSSRRSASCGRWSAPSCGRATAARRRPWRRR